MEWFFVDEKLKFFWWVFLLKFSVVLINFWEMETFRFGKIVEECWLKNRFLWYLRFSLKPLICLKALFNEDLLLHHIPICLKNFFFSFYHKTWQAPKKRVRRQLLQFLISLVRTENVKVIHHNSSTFHNPWRQIFCFTLVQIREKKIRKRTKNL